MKFRKKPVVIEAWQWQGQSKHDWPHWLRISDCVSRREDGRLFIETPEGGMFAKVNDWIIRGINGELYPCKPDIFAVTYEPEQTVDP